MNIPVHRMFSGKPHEAVPGEWWVTCGLCGYQDHDTDRAPLFRRFRLHPHLQRHPSETGEV